MRVIAIKSIKDGKLRSYGNGEYIGDLVPNVDPFNKNGIKNPCIKLESGKYVWGFQCWWGNIEEFFKKYKINETTIVSIDSINPVEEKSNNYCSCCGKQSCNGNCD